jgi:short-subunit dehydrogenase
VLSLHARAGSALYSATKAWVLSFTRGLQEEFADSGVRIQAVLPAATATEIGICPASRLPTCRKAR